MATEKTTNKLSRDRFIQELCIAFASNGWYGENAVNEAIKIADLLRY